VRLSAVHVDIAEQNCVKFGWMQPGHMAVAGKELVNLLPKQGPEMSFVVRGISVKIGSSRRLYEDMKSASKQTVVKLLIDWRTAVA
jgi:hypothetical protein